MLAAVLGFAAATGACPTGPSWCAESKFDGTEYVTVNYTNPDAYTPEIAIAHYLTDMQGSGITKNELCSDEIRETVRDFHLRELSTTDLVLEPNLIITASVDKRAVDWVLACDTPLELELRFLPAVLCLNAPPGERPTQQNAAMYCKESNKPIVVRPNCETETARIVDCPGGGGGDDMTLAIILSVVAVAVVALVVVAVVYKRNAGDRPAGSITGTLL